MILRDGQEGGSDRSTRRRQVLARLSIVACMALAVGLVSTVDLSRPVPDPDIDIDDDLPTAGSPLSDAEVELLRQQSDPDRLRCEPRGCELWRFDRNGAPMGSGAVELRDGLVAVLVGAYESSRIDAVTRELHIEEHGHRLLAIDPATGDERWSRPIGDFTSVSGAYRWVRLVDGPDGGGLIVSGATVTAFDADGTQRWVARADITGGALRQVWDAVTARDAVVVRGTILDRSTANQLEYVTALDPRTGQVLWTEEVQHVAVLDPDTLVVVDPDGTMRSLSHATGRPQWERSAPETVEAWVRLEGTWIAIQEFSGLRLLDPDTGDDVGRIDGWLTGSLVPVGDRWIGTTRQLENGTDAAWWRDEAGPMQALSLDADGSVAWTSRIGTVRPWRECCPIRSDPDEGTVTVRDPTRSLEYDLVTGDLVDARVVARDGGSSPGSDGLAASQTWRPRPDVQVSWHADLGRLEIDTPDGEVVIRGGRGIAVDSIDPIVVVDDDHIMGVSVVPER